MFDRLKTTYSNKKVFLTGHTGFKGSWLLKILSMLGAEVKGYALAPENDFDLYYLLNGNKLCDSVIADLRDRITLTKAINDFQPDFVFHLAAQPLVRLSYDMPVDTFEINVIGTANVLQAIKTLTNPCYAVMITTDKVYHNNEWVYPYRENDRLGGYDPYSASKACTELVIDSFRNSFFNTNHYSDHKKAIAVGRAGNVIGGGDWAKDRLIPDIARAIGNGKKVTIRNPLAIRPWQHVLEPLVGYLLLGKQLYAEPQKFSQAYNFGPNVDDALTVEEMVKQSITKWGTGQYEFIHNNANPHEAGLLKLDISKVVNQVGYKPVTAAADAISLTIDWYKNYFTGKNNSADFTQMQIQNFFDIK